jgi:hypothetical protein
MKQIDKVFYKCTEPRSYPNLSHMEDKVTGRIEEAQEPIRRGSLIVYLGCGCEFWVKGKYNKEIVDFT